TNIMANFFLKQRKVSTQSLLYDFLKIQKIKKINLKMFRFFRNIRQKLAAENKAMAYLRYAIGEIVLVVIGILIALQINNWNATRIEKSKELVYLKNIKRDLNEQIKSIDAQIYYELNMSQKARRIIKYYKEHHK